MIVLSMYPSFDFCSIHSYFMVEKDYLCHTVLFPFLNLKKICNAVNFYWLINCLNIGWL